MLTQEMNDRITRVGPRTPMDERGYEEIGGPFCGQVPREPDVEANL